MNEAYQHPAMPEAVEDDIVKGMYLLETLEMRRALESEYWVAVHCYPKQGAPPSSW